MVRKRTRTQRRKEDVSEEESQSEEEVIEKVEEETPPKRYSLRQRKKAVPTEDFLYGELSADESDAESYQEEPESSSDDEFDVSEALEVEHKNPVRVTRTRPRKKVKSEDEHVDESAEEETPNDSKEEIHDDGPSLEDNDGMIDFEDIIRADILVNSNKIDYDNVIEKTEIKVNDNEECSEKVQKPKPRRKRGRKSKKEIEEELAQLQELEDEPKEVVSTNGNEDSNEGTNSEEVVVTIEPDNFLLDANFDKNGGQPKEVAVVQ